MPKKSIGIIGGGFVGGAIAGYYRKANHPVKIYDKYKSLDSLEEVLKQDVIFIAVPTPSNEKGIDLSAVEDALSNAAKADAGKVVILKSTVIPGTTERLQQDYPHLRIVFNPEFLTESTAVQDFAYPDRQIVGYTEKSHRIAGDVMQLLPLAPFCRVVPATVAEMVKYYGNNWFAVKVVFANQMYDICQKLGIDYDLVAECAAADKRIGPSHLEVWHKGYRGYGGKCLPKDIQAMIKLGDALGVDLKLLKTTEELNQILRDKGRKEAGRGVRGSRILITGGAGFIGSHVAKRLIEQGSEVVIIDNFNPYYNPKLKQARIDIFLKGLPFKLYRGDISDFYFLQTVFSAHKFDKVCHLAAQAGVRHSLKNPFVYERSNNVGTLNLLELCRRFKVRDFIFASTSSVYGLNENLPFSEETSTDTPISVYAATKKYNEVLAHVYHRLFGLHCTALRFFTVYGPWGRPDMALFLFINAILKGEQIKVFNAGDMQRDFTYIDDIVEGVVAALDKSYPFEIFNLGRGESQTLNDFIAALENSLGKKAERKNLPMQPGDVKATAADISKARQLLGFNPKVSIAEGIRKFVEWYQRYADQLELDKF